MHVMPAGGPSAAAKDDDEAMAAISSGSAAAGNTGLVEGCMVWLVVFLELIAMCRCSILSRMCRYTKYAPFSLSGGRIAPSINSQNLNQI